MPINSNIPQCQYIRTDGRRCGSPALKTKRWCYFHYEVNRPTVNLDVPPLEDGNAVQLALTDLARAVADDRIPLKNAALLAYILQTASANLKKVQLGVFTDHMITDLPDLDPYSRGLSISDPSAPPQSSVILSEAASASEGPGRPPRKPALSEVEGAREGRIRPASSAVEGQGFNPTEKDGPTAPSALPEEPALSGVERAQVSEGHGFSRAKKAGPTPSSALPKAGAQPATGAAPGKGESASSRGPDLTHKIAAAKSGSVKDLKELLDFVQDAS